MSDSNNTTSSSTSPSHPSMIGGHARYIQGAISSTLGYPSGEDTKKEAVEEMRAANEPGPKDQQQPQEPPTQNTVLGTIEKKIGELTGCEGLESDGNKRIPEKGGVEETSGTG